MFVRFKVKCCGTEELIINKGQRRYVQVGLTPARHEGSISAGVAEEFLKYVGKRMGNTRRLVTKVTKAPRVASHRRRLQTLFYMAHLWHDYKNI